MYKFKKILQICFVFLGFVIVSGCGCENKNVVVDSAEDKEVVENNKSCEVDSDCVLASCCHATDVVNKENAPSCENLKCTASCETILDCGQGKPVCGNGQCRVERNFEVDRSNLRVEEDLENDLEIEDIKEIEENKEDNIENEGCASEGENFSDVYEEYPKNCCEGLVEWQSGMDTKISIEDECYKTGLVSGNPVGTCINCGDGTCSENEDVCNCDEDCGAENSDFKTVKEFCESGEFKTICSLDLNSEKKVLNSHTRNLCNSCCEEFDICLN